MENSTPSPQQTVQINASQTHMIQQGASTTTPIQIFAQDGGGTGKAFYIIDPSQVTNGLQMISNADQRFEINGSGASTTATASPQPLSGAQPAAAAQQTVVVSVLSIFYTETTKKLRKYGAEKKLFFTVFSFIFVFFS